MSEPKGQGAEELAASFERVRALRGELEAALAEGNDVEVRRLRPLLDHARERWQEQKQMAAVLEAASVAARQSQDWQEAALAEALHGLLYHYGADEVSALEVVERSPTRLKLVGKVCWVDSQSSDLVEATFTLDEGDGSISHAVIRAADRVAKSDQARGSAHASARAWARRIANRPEHDERWKIVIRYPTA